MLGLPPSLSRRSKIDASLPARNPSPRPQHSPMPVRKPQNSPAASRPLTYALLRLSMSTGE